MQSDDSSSHPSSSNESPSDARACETFSELMRKMTNGKTTVDEGDVYNSYDSSASSCNAGEISPPATARKIVQYRHQRRRQSLKNSPRLRVMMLPTIRVNKGLVRSPGKIPQKRRLPRRLLRRRLHLQMAKEKGWLHNFHAR